MLHKGNKTTINITTVVAHIFVGFKFRSFKPNTILLAFKFCHNVIPLNVSTLYFYNTSVKTRHEFKQV